MVLMTSRDEAMLEWLRVVRFADSEAIRWALPAIQSGAVCEPVHRRRAQAWIHRMAELGLVQRDRLSMQGNYVVWPSAVVTGRRGPNLFGQTMRHELAVALTSARYLARGYQWARDQRPANGYSHQLDGIARIGDLIEYLEIELTPKSIDRYRQIFYRLGERLELDANVRLTYLCTADAARIVLREADRNSYRDLRERIRVLPLFDKDGNMAPSSASGSSIDRGNAGRLAAG